MFHTCKVTVIQRNFNKEISEKYLQHPERMRICDRVQDNQEFIVTNPFELPEKMCASAWADIRGHILTMATGGSYDFSRDKEVTIATCTDPFRPVLFQIERISKNEDEVDV